MLPVARQEKLLIQEVGDEVVVYDQVRDRAHSLNSTAALVWRNCDGKTSIAQLAALVAAEQGLPADEEVVWLALGSLEECDLLVTPVSRSSGGVSRREVVRKLGLAGAVALLLPAVTTIAAPTPLEAQSPVVRCPRNGVLGDSCTIPDDLDEIIAGALSCQCGPGLWCAPLPGGGPGIFVCTEIPI